MGELVRSDSPIGDLPRDAALLIEGPPMTGKYALLLTLLAHYSDETILISTKHAADRVESDFADVAGGSPPGRVGVIDCVPRPGPMTEPAGELVRVAGSPDNLTRIGVAFTELFDVFYDESSDSATGVGVHSVSQLLMHAGLQPTYQFLQVLTGQVRAADWLLAAVLEATADDEERQTLYQHFDGVVQTRHDEAEGRQLRVRGLSPTVSEWAAF